MERWKVMFFFNFKNSFLLPTKAILVKFTPNLKHKAKENRHSLVNLYKDLEACGGYGDIQVMWEMLQSSNATKTKTSNKSPHWRFCFSPA